MTSLRYRSTREACQSFTQGLREYEKVCYWVTDRRRLVNQSDYDLEWGKLIMLLAWENKLDLIRKRCREDAEAAPDEDAGSHFAQLRESVAAYLADFRLDVERDLEEQFQRSIVARMRTALDAPAALRIIEDFERFLDELDTAEMFVEAAEKHFPGASFRQRFDTIEREIRTYIVKHLWPELVNEYGPDLQRDLGAPWLSSRYWWRHLK